MLHLVLFHLFLQLLVLLDFIVKHHCYLIDPFFELLVFIFELLIRYPERNIENTSSMDIVVYSFKPSIDSKTDSKENK